MNILECVEKSLLPRLKSWDAKDFFNRMITEYKGQVPTDFFPVEIWEKNRNWTTPIDFENHHIRQLFYVANITYCWMISKPEYVIPPQLLKEVVETEPSKVLPLSLLSTIPHWTGYVNLEGAGVKVDEGEDEEVSGILVSTVRNANGEQGVTVLFPYAKSTNPQVFFIPFAGNLTLHELVSADPSIVQAAKEFNITPQEAAVRLERDGQIGFYAKIVNVLLFIAQEFGLEERHQTYLNFKNKQLKRSGKKYSLSFLNAHRKYPVGFDYLTQVEKANSGRGPTDRAAHTRRAHWHGYWTGSRTNPEAQQLKIHWIRRSVISATTKKSKVE